MKRHRNASIDQRLWFRARQMFLDTGGKEDLWPHLPNQAKQQWYDKAWDEYGRGVGR